MGTIRVWGYLDELAAERREIQDAIDRVLDSGWLILGQEVQSFEDRFSAWCGVRHGVGVNSGTDALFLALKGLGVGAGDEVVTVSNTAVPTVAAIVSTGARPRFVDIDPKTYLMDVSQLEQVVNGATSCILPVHMYGQCVDVRAVRRVAESRGIKILEDCAQAHGATSGGTKAGALGDAAAFSFYPTKILGGYGDGGMLLTDDEDLAHRVRRLRMYGMEGEYYPLEHGYNSRLDELHAAILLGKLSHIDAYLARRRRLAARYDELLADTDLGLPCTAPGGEHAWYLYVVRHPQRDAIIAKLKAFDIHLNVSYRWPVHLTPAYRSLGYGEGDLPGTESAAKEIFSLPTFPSLGDDDQERVCARLREVMADL
jgi:aminotransferase EvaB